MKVLRTYYIPEDTDRLLQLISFKLNLPKGELVCKLLDQKLMPVNEFCKETNTCRDLLTKQELMNLLGIK